MTDVELLRRYAEDRSEAAFTELVSRNIGVVYAAALRQLGGAAHRAQDVTQTVFLDLARKARPLSRRQEIVGWLYTSTHFSAAKLKRGEQRRQLREQEAHMIHEASAGSEPEVNWAQLRSVLDDAMQALGERDREAILMRFFQGRAFAELGRQLGLREDAARMRVERALEKLRVALGGRGITSTTAALAVALTNPGLAAAPAGLAASVASAALAGSATATGIFMSTTTAVLSAVALAAVGMSVYEFTQANRVDRELAALRRDRDAARAEIGKLQQQLAQANERSLVAESRATVLEREVQTAQTSKSIGLPATSAGASSAGWIALSPIPAPSDPAEARRQAREMNIASRDNTYRAFYRQAGFTPAQVEQFRALMVESMDRQQAQTQTTMKTAMAQTPKPDRAAMQTLFESTVRQSHEEWLGAIRANFGDGVFAAFQHYSETIPAREVSKELSNVLFYTGVPLAPTQADQLVEIVAANARDAQGKVSLAAINGASVLAEAPTVLSPEQAAALPLALRNVQTRLAAAAARAASSR